MEQLKNYILGFRCGGGYFRVLMNRGILKHDIIGYYLDAELLGYKLRDTLEFIDKLHDLYSIEIKRIWMPDGFYYIHTYKRI